MTEAAVAAALQLCCTADRAANLERALALVDRAAEAGAQLVALPENVDFIGPAAEKLAGAQPLDGPLVQALRGRAAARRVWLCGGSFAERIDGSPRFHNTSVLIDPAGALVAAYRKIHLFDADPPDGVSYRESRHVEPGRAVVTAATALGVAGLSICYDLRFPELYRALSARGASILLVPSAFTVPTGRAHWELLLRARAVENFAYVVAPAQAGRHSDTRRSWGHAMIVGPRGDVLAQCDAEQEGFCLARLDPAELARARAELPALEHRRLAVQDPA
jgi:predicted amidohydrolase